MPNDTSDIESKIECGMMRFILFLCVLGLAVPAGAADIALSNGRLLQDAEITSVVPGGVVIRHQGGIGRFPIAELSPTDQAKVEKLFPPVKRTLRPAPNPAPPPTVSQEDVVQKQSDDQEEIGLEIIKVEREIDRRIGDHDYDAGISFDGRSWYLHVVHYASWIKDSLRDGDWKKGQERETTRQKYWDSTYRSELFRDTDHKENVDLYKKFLEWDNIATSNHVAPFSKQIARLRGIYNQDFVWDGKCATLFPKTLDSTEVRLFVELLANSDDMRREWKVKKTESNSAKTLFK